MLHDRAFAEAGTDILTDADEVIAALAEMAEAKTVGLDLETKNKRPYLTDSRILTVGLSSALRTVAFPLHHDGAGWSRRRVPAHRGGVGGVPARPAPAQNLVPTVVRIGMVRLIFMATPLCTRYGATPRRQADLLEPHSPPTQAERMDSLSLEFIGLNYFGIDIKAINNTDRKNLDKTPVDVVLRYNAIDAKYHRLAYLAELPLLAGRGGAAAKPTSTTCAALRRPCSASCKACR